MNLKNSEYKKDFPLVFENPDIHYLDSAATAQRPKLVIDAIKEYSETANGNAGRGSHSLAIASSTLVEETRQKVAEFIGAKNCKDIVFTKNCTESLNIIAYSYALNNLTKDDEILLAISNHHANIVPWQFVAKQVGAKIKYIYLNEDASLDLDDFKSKLSSKTKIMAVSAVVNTLGIVNPIKELIDMAHDFGAITVVDAAQSITHFKQNVSELDCDFFVFSGHKIFSAFGVGVLYGKTEFLDAMPPFLYGGDMINFVTEESAEFKDAPHKFEGGTMNASAIASLKAAIEYIEKISYENIEKAISEISDYALMRLKELDFVETYCTDAKNRIGIIAFNVKDVHSHDTSHILNEYGVMVRSGHHCTQPLMHYFDIHSCCRASFSIFNTKEDVDQLIIALKKVKSIFG